MVGERGKEDYLRTIYELYEERDGVRSIDIAEKLGTSKASVSEMLRKLAKENLIKVKPYSKIFLTQKGKKQGKNLFDKHHIIKQFIKKFIRHGEEKAKEEAHKLEHALSEESVKVISRLLNENYKEEFKFFPSYVS
jgi:DtxR family Mn-dependent transcriptional regulator